jgi:hypothetical protein
MIYSITFLQVSFFFPCSATLPEAEPFLCLLSLGSSKKVKARLA